MRVSDEMRHFGWAGQHRLWLVLTAAVLFGFQLRAVSEDFFDTNRVIDVQIQIVSSDWKVLRYQHRESDFFPETDNPPATNAYTCFPATVTIDGHRFTEAKVRKKGYIGSNDTKRPGLKVQLGGSRADGTKSSVTELTLNNNNQDSSLIRQYLAYEVFRRAGVPSPRCCFARVTVNGASLGVFTHVEAIKRPFLKRSFGRDDGQLYEGGRSDFRSGWFRNFEIKSEGKTPPHADLEAATKAIEDPGKALLPVLNRYLDLDEFLRFWAVESLINDADGYAANVNNFYLYHSPVTDKFNFIPWGADTVMYSGRRGGDRESGPKSVIAVGVLAYRFYSSTEGCERYRATLRQVLKEAWNEEALLKEVDRLQTLLSSSSGASADQVTAEIEGVRRFIKTRRSDIEPELAGPPLALKSKPLEIAKRRNVGHFDASFSAPWGKLNQAEPLGPGEGSLSGKLYGQNLTFDKVGTQAGALGGLADDARPGITIGGVEKNGGRGFLIYLVIDPELYASGAVLPVNNTHVFGGFMATNAKGQITNMVGMLRGTLRLRTAAQEPDVKVEGDVSVDVFSKLPAP